MTTTVERPSSALSAATTQHREHLERLAVGEDARDGSSNERGIDAPRQEILSQDPLGCETPSGGPGLLGGRRGTRRVDLCGLDYGDRRRSLFSALRDLDPGEQIELMSDRADDVLWLRYEVEARIAERYFWSLPDESRQTARITVRRLRPSAGLDPGPHSRHDGTLAEHR